MRKVLLATAIASLPSAVALAQPVGGGGTYYPATGDAQRNLDPGAAEKPYTPPPPPKSEPQKPNVMVVGPDG